MTIIKWLSKALALCLLFPINITFASERYIHIIRHGQGEHNIKHLYNSNPNHPNYTVANLTPLGKKQVGYTAQKLRIQKLTSQQIAAVFISPLPRTQQTAHILQTAGLFSEAQMHIDDRIIEIQAGSMEGKTYDPRNHDWHNPTPKVDDGEDSDALRCRMQAFYNDVIERYPEGDLVVVTHGSPSMQLIELIADLSIQLSTADVISIPVNSTKIHKQVCQEQKTRD